MKRNIAFAIISGMLLCGCQQIELTPSLMVSKTFYATIEDNSQTKTSLDNNGNVLWKQGDQVSLFDASTINKQYQVDNASDGKTSATLSYVGSSSYAAGTSIDNNVAFYPYAAGNTIAKNGGNYEISCTIPATQTYAAGSFGNGAFPMVAVTSLTSDKNLVFKNVLGAIKLQLKGTATITSISISGNNNEILCGAATVTASNGNVPSIALSEASAKTVTLDCGAGVTLNTTTATAFTIALPPTTLSGGFTVTVADSEGKQMEIKTVKSQTIARSGRLVMPEKTYEGTAATSDYTSKPFTITSTGSTSVSISKHGLPYDISLEFRIGNGDWGAYTIGTAVSLSDGESLQFRAGEVANTNFSKDLNNYYQISVTGEGTITVSGYIMSLFDRNSEKKSVNKYEFAYLFKGCSKLTDASKLILSATSLATNSYQEMFADCTSLTTPPSILASLVDDFCCYGMFYYCTSLTTAPPTLPATKLAYSCYNSMFAYCTSLTTVPELPATTLAGYCYSNMFGHCTSLTAAPTLPATSLASNCYYSMFYGCTGLTQAPVLPVTSLVNNCYKEMFRGCTGLTNAPTLPATSLADGCYWSMFYGCTGLTNAPTLPVTSLVDNCYKEMFRGCTGLTNAPALPATTLASNCYSSMFRECTGLTQAPVLPATSLADNCYDSMFRGCTNLKYVKALFTTKPSSSYTWNWLSGVSSTGTFVKSKDATWDVTGANGIPDGWTVITE